MNNPKLLADLAAALPKRPPTFAEAFLVVTFDGSPLGPGSFNCELLEDNEDLFGPYSGDVEKFSETFEEATVKFGDGSVLWVNELGKVRVDARRASYADRPTRRSRNGKILRACLLARGLDPDGEDAYGFVGGDDSFVGGDDD